MSDLEIMKQNLEILQNENTSLKNQIQIYKEKENSYQSSISRIKKIQSEYESSYQQSINDCKAHEEEIKKKYYNYQKILENQNEQNEKRLNNEILLLKSEQKEKDKIIQSLNEKINLLNEKLSKDEINYYVKEKEYEDIIISKERKLSELNDAIKQIVEEANEEIKRLSQQLEEFENKSKSNNPINNVMERETVENNLNVNLGMLNKSVDDIKNKNNHDIINNNNSNNNNNNDIMKQSQNMANNSFLLSDRFKNTFNDGINSITTPQKANNSFILNNKYSNDYPMLYPQNNYMNKATNNNSAIGSQNLMTQLYLLQNDKNVLANELKQKEKEVNFWKNIRSDMYSKNQVQNNSANNSINFSTNKYLNDMKLKNMEKTLVNYGNNIDTFKKQYNQSLKYHQKEIDKLKNDMGNNANMGYNKTDGGITSINRFEEVPKDLREQKKSTNEDLLHALKVTIPSKEGIRNEYINSQLQQIKNLDNKE